METRSIAVFGAGSWGTALAIVLAEKGHDVTLWARRAEAAQELAEKRTNERYLPGITIPDSIRITSDLDIAGLAGSFWVFAVPSQSVRPIAQELNQFASDETVVVSVAKGIENETLLTTTHVLDDSLEHVPIGNIGVLYGPSHAEEVAAYKPTTIVAAAHSEDIARMIQEVFITDRLRVYFNPDVTGVEIGGSVKNVLAIAAGISDGLGYGDNAKAAIISRGMAEIRRLGLAMGAEPSTFSGLAGIGDVVVTCMSKWSRNRRVGEEIGQGKRLDEVIEGMSMVAEGVQTTQSVYQLAERYDIEMPITRSVYEVLFEDKDPLEAVDDLMTRQAKREEWLPDVMQD